MSVLLYVLGVLCVCGGAVAVLFGLPVKEFSFGNTLIITGATGVVGGLIVIGLGAAVSQLHRVVEMLGARPLSRAGRPLESLEQPNTGAGRIPFPPKPKIATRDRLPETRVAAAMPSKTGEPDLPPPTLRNPDVPLMAEEEAEELPLSPRDGGASRGEPAAEAPSAEAADEPEHRSFEPSWRSPPPPKPAQPSYFENMWPSAERSPPPAEPQPSRSETIARAPSAPESKPEVEEPAEEATPVAVLKSGVVDGMGYTLYVDGSIEAELPDGTLRFASINELRMHLEKNA